MEDIDFKKIGKYMPSQRFALIIGITAGGILLILIVTSYFGSKSSFTRNSKIPVSGKDTVGTLVSKDSNNNGIPDWEESLWGLDPTADGAINKVAIAEKRQAAGIPTLNDSETQPVNQTDAFSRQLLSTILALDQSGNLTPQAIQNLAATVGSTVQAQHVQVSLYTLDDMHKSGSDSAAAKKAYSQNLKSIIAQYHDVGIGSELSIIAEGFEGGGAPSLQKLIPIANAYQGIAVQVAALPTPPSALPYALALANSSLQVSASLGQAATFYDNVVAGMVGIDDYIKASHASDTATANMRTYLHS